MAELQKHQGDFDTFFSAISASKISSDNNNRLKTAFQLSSLTNDHLPLTNHLIKSKKIKNAADIKSLAANTRADWEKLIKAEKMDVPSSIKGKSKTEKIKNFAEVLERNFTKAYPTAAFSARLKKDAKSSFEDRKT